MIERLATFAMGTRFELVLAGDDVRRLRVVGEAVIEQIDDLERRWSLFRRDSLLSFINRHAAERPVPVDAETFEVLSIAEQVRRDSGGLFDVTVGAAMERWGFREKQFTTESPRAQRGGEPGGTEEVPDTTSGHASSLRSLRLCGETSSVRFTRPGIILDLGGIAKGYAVDAAMRSLREHGVTRALIHSGTSCVGAIGAPPGRDAWMISIAGEGAPAVALQDSCLAVSAPSGREIEAPGGRIGHIMDPRTGRPAACGRLACVTGPSAALCDAWTKPALIEGARPARLGAAYATIIDAGEGRRAPDAGGGPPVPMPLPCTTGTLR